MRLRYYILGTLLTLAMGVTGQNLVPGKYASGNGSGYSRSDVNFGVTLSGSVNPVCERSATTLTATVKGDGQFRYSWRKIGDTKSLSNTLVLDIPQATLRDAGRYYCLVDDGRATVSSDTLDLRVIALPVAAIVRPDVRDTIICHGDTLMVMGTSSVSGTTLTWSGPQIIPTATPNIIHVAPLSAAVYVLKADNEGCSTTDTLRVAINTPYINIPSVINTSEGNRIEITALDREGDPVVSNGSNLSWYKGAQRLGTANPLVLTPRSAVDIDVKYTSGGCLATGMTRVLIKGAGSYRGGNDDGFATTCLPPVIISQHGIEREQCVSLDSTQLVVVAEGTNIRYEWQKLDSYSETFVTFIPPVGSDISGMNSGTLKIRKISDNINGQYRCVLSNGCTTEDVISDTFNISVKGEPVIKSGINIGRDQCVASGATMTWNIIAEASAGTGHLTYRWYKDGRQISVEDDTLNNYYQFQIRDPNGAEEGVYVVHVANECGIAGDTAFLPVVFPPKAAACSRNVYACVGGEAEFTVQPAHSGDYTYTLYEYDLKTGKFGVKVASGSNRIVVPNVTKSGHYCWVITHPYCGVSSAPLEQQPGRSDVMYLLVEQPPRFTVQPSPLSDTACMGTTVRYTCVATAATVGEGAQPIRYNWYREGVLLNAIPQTDGTLTLASVSPEQSGVYYCTAFNSCTPVKSAEVSLKVTGKPQFAGSPSALSEYCAGESVTFRGSLSSLYPVDSVRWFFSGRPLYDIPGRMHGTGTVEMVIDSIAAEDEGGIFQLRAYNRCDYGTSSGVTFKVRQPARFVHSLEDGGVKMLMCSGENQTLTVEAMGTPPLRFTWLLNGDTLVNSNSNILNIKGVNLDSKGKYSCHVQNSCGDELTSTTIEISRPDTFRLEGGGEFCTNNEGVNIWLVGSDTTDIYRLYNKTTGQMLKEVAGKSINPPFDRIFFNNLRGGTYYVTATDTNSCEYRMPGEAVIRENLLPADYRLLVKRYICPGSVNGDLQLDGSQPDMEYALCRRNSWTWDTVAIFPGTGRAVDLPALPAGDYKVHVRNMLTGCHRDLSVIATLAQRAAPVVCRPVFDNNDSTYCVNTKSNVALSLPCYESGNSYQLFCNNKPVGGIVTTNNLYWSGLDEGRYEVRINNSWGCTAVTASRQVITQALPPRFQLIGTRYFCDYDVDDCFIELTNSREGTLYSFRRLNGAVLKDTLSRGGSIRMLISPVEENRFYVVATDTTPEHCTAAMFDTVSLIRSRLQVIPTTPVTVSYNDTKDLAIQVTGHQGNMADVMIRWDNSKRLIDGATNTLTPRTVKMTSSQFFPVTVSDASCMVASGVQVNCIGGDLTVEIKTDGCTTAAPDTIRLCSDEPIALCGMASGGATGNYAYRWLDADGEVATTARLSDMMLKRDGYLWLEATDHNETALDSVWMEISTSPRVDTLEQSGRLCVAMGSPVALRLKNSLSAASYQVEYKADGADWQELAGQVQNGQDDRSIEFMILDGMTVQGFLRVVASIPNKRGDGFCGKVMYGEVEVRRGVQPFTVSGNGAYCAGAINETTISLDGSEADVTYRLTSPGLGSNAPTQAGSGLPLVFTGEYPAGIYRIVGETTYCRDTMPGSAEIIENPLPLIDTLYGAGYHCTADGGVRAGISNAIPNVVYTLTRTAPDGTVTSQEFYGNDVLLFGELLEVGDYSVSARNTVTGCEASDTRVIGIRNTPADIHFEGGGLICSNGGGTTAVTLKVYPAEADVVYTLYRTDGQTIGTFGSPLDDSLYYSGLLSAGNYIVKGQLDRCAREYSDTVRVTTSPLPDVDEFIGAGSYCTSDGSVVAGIRTGRPNTEYTLTYTPLTGAETKTLYYGESTISFGELSAVGIYTLASRDTLTGCEVTDPRRIVIGHSPGDIHCEGGGYLCGGEQTKTVTIKLSQTESTVTYRLYRVGGSLVGTFGSPEGNNLYYTGALSEGAYIVKGQVGNCDREYRDTLRVLRGITLELPELARPLGGCENNPPRISMTTSMPGIVYTLYRKATPDNQLLQTLTGNGHELTFTPENIAGTYFIGASDPVSGCSRDLFPEYTVEKLPLTFDITGETEYCETAAGVVIGINGSELLIKYTLQRQKADGEWEDVTGGTLTGSGYAANFYGRYPAGTYRVVAGTQCRQPMNGTLTVQTVAHPDRNLALQVEGNPCIDSTIIVTAASSETGLTYILYQDDQIVTGSEQMGGGRLEWTIMPDTKCLYTVKTTVRECTVTLKDSIRTGQYAGPIPPFAGDTLYCEGGKAEIYLTPYQKETVYVLSSLPDGFEVARGVASGDRMTFGGLEAGTYVARAYAGGCIATGTPQAIRSVVPPAMAQWKLNDCVNADSGVITIRACLPEYEYILSREYGETLSVKAHRGDTTFRQRPVGSYRLTVRDTASGCESPVLEANIREGVYDDSLRKDPAYCAGDPGAVLTLSGVHRSIDYSVNSLTGPIQTIRYPETAFRPLPKGSYLFRKVRTGALGGCQSQKTFVIKENDPPLTDLRVRVHGDNGALCAGGSYQVEVLATQENKAYILQTTGKALDTVYGNNNSQLFDYRISVAGNYNILVRDTLTDCFRTLDTLLRIHPLPQKVTVEDCHYCRTGSDVSDQCGISLSGMLPDHLYRLRQGVDLDTLTGYGRGTFKSRKAGAYLVVIESATTGCTDTLPGNITAFPVPRLFNVASVCRELPATVSVQTDGSEGDTILYYLYKDGRPTVLNALPGTGSPIGFDNLSEAGTYRIFAQHVSNGCGLFMTDSVVLYEPRTEKDTLLVVGGDFCENSTGTGAILRIPGSTQGWRYYITNGLFESDTLAGNGRMRSWMEIGGQPITGGEYELYAISPCGVDLFVARNKVEAQKAPELYPLVNNHLSLCTGGKFELALTNSDIGVTYIVKRFSSSTNKLEKEYRIVSPANGPLSLGEYNATGVYEISAYNGCISEKTHTLIIESGTVPERLTLIGNDVCIGADGNTIQISLPSREEKVSYYLFAGDQQMDILTGDPLTALDFRPQSQTGAYTVVARHDEDGCERVMKGTYYLNTAPEVKNLLPVSGNVCEGTPVCLELQSAEAGIRYTILNENGTPVSEIAGDAALSPFRVGCVTANGTYTVQASVSSCTATMNGSVTVTTTPLPYLSIADDYHFCDGSRGASIAVFAPTEAGHGYRLYAPDGTLCEELPGAADGEDITFKAMKIPGVYSVEVYDAVSGCAAVDSVELIRDKRPDAVELSASGKGYICEGESVNISLEMTEMNTSYTLYRTGTDESVSGPIYGTGKAMTFPQKMKVAGTYYVEAKYESDLQCTNTFGALEVRQAAILTPYRLLRVKSSYCETDDAKGALRLEGSQNGILYRLTRDAAFTDNDQWGRGAALNWTQLEGKPCGELLHKNDGYRYRVMAVDTLSGCTRQMLGDDTITEVNPVIILAQEPNEAQMLRCEGSRVQFSATTVGCRETYTWYHDGGRIPGSNRSYYNIDALQMKDYGEYYCEVTNACGRVVTTTPVNLEVRELVKVETPLEDRAICDDRAQDIMLAAGFRNATSYRWYKADEPERTLSNTVYLELPGADKTVSGQYVCVGNNHCDVEVRDTADVFFGQRPDITIGDLRTDTLCVGMIYDKLRITPGVGVVPQWYRGTTPLNFTGNRLVLMSVAREDEGPYLVKASNACGESTLHLGTLYVDDYMRVVDASPARIIQCVGNSQRLFVNINPAERVNYTWEYTDGTRIENASSQLVVGPFQEVTSQTYWVRFMNKCGMTPGDYNYREFAVHVPMPFVLPTDLPRDIITCSEPRDTVIRLNMDPMTYANYKWWYRKNKSDVNRILLPSDADTLGIPCRTSSTGYYYCDLSNECDAKTTETIWVRIDTVPVLLGGLPPIDTICEGGQLRLSLPATGGGLHYDWYIQKKGSITPEVITYIGDDFESVGELRLTVTAAHDESLIWCHAHNKCGEKTTNKMLLRVDKRRQVEITPADTTVCAGSFARIQITLHNGRAPWSYRYVQEENPDITETFIADNLTDVLRVNKRGTYTVSFISDGGKCNYADGNTTFRINNFYVPEARVVVLGKDTLCSGERAQMMVSITYPPLPGGVKPSDGPWEIVFVNSRNEVMNDRLGVANPLIVYRENATNDAITYTLPPFYLSESETIYIGSVKDMSAGGDVPCPGIGIDSARYVIGSKDNLRFDIRSGKDTVGICEQVRLDTLLRPNLPGKFYIDGIVTLNNYFSGAIAGVGEHIVTYETEGICPAIGKISLWVVPAPELTIVPADTSLCLGQEVDIRISAKQCGPYHLRYELRNEKRDGTSPTVNIFERDDLPFSVRVKYSADSDSLRFITPLLLTDRFGCSATTLPQARVHLLGYPEFEIWGQYPPKDGDDWKFVYDPYIIPEGDSVCFKISYTKGTKPWYCNILNADLGTLDLGPIYGNDTIFKAGAQGRYQFKALNTFYCERPLHFKEAYVFYRQNGYLRIRTMLQGPFVERDGRPFMRADLQKLGILQREGLTNCPVTGTDSIVDVIVAELRENMDSAPVARDTFLLRNDGQLLTRSGNDTLMFTNTDKLMDANAYYIVLNHRNHLSVISGERVSIADEAHKDRVVNYDFTVAGAAYCPAGSKPENHMIQMSATCWAMAAGYPFLEDELISITNPNLTKQASENEIQRDYYGYYWRDVNMNGIVEFPITNTPDGFIYDDSQVNLFKTKDSWILHRNRNKYSAVPAVK